MEWKILSFSFVVYWLRRDAGRNFLGGITGNSKNKLNLNMNFNVEFLERGGLGTFLDFLVDSFMNPQNMFNNCALKDPS